MRSCYKVCILLVRTKYRPLHSLSHLCKQMIVRAAIVGSWCSRTSNAGALQRECGCRSLQLELFLLDMALYTNMVHC